MERVKKDATNSLDLSKLFSSYVVCYFISFPLREIANKKDANYPNLKSLFRGARYA